MVGHERVNTPFFPFNFLILILILISSSSLSSAPCTTDLPESLLTIAASARIKNLVHLGKKVIFSYFEEESQISLTKFDFCFCCNRQKWSKNIRNRLFFFSKKTELTRNLSRNIGLGTAPLDRVFEPYSPDSTQILFSYPFIELSSFSFFLLLFCFLPFCFFNKTKSPFWSHCIKL